MPWGEAYAGTRRREEKRERKKEKGERKKQRQQKTLEGIQE